MRRLKFEEVRDLAETQRKLLAEVDETIRKSQAAANRVYDRDLSQDARKLEYDRIRGDAQEKVASTLSAMREFAVNEAGTQEFHYSPEAVRRRARLSSQAWQHALAAGELRTTLANASEDDLEAHAVDAAAQGGWESVAYGELIRQEVARRGSKFRGSAAVKARLAGIQEPQEVVKARELLSQTKADYEFASAKAQGLSLLSGAPKGTAAPETTNARLLRRAREIAEGITA